MLENAEKFFELYTRDEALRTAVKSLSDSPLEVELVFDDKAAFDRAGEQYPELV